MTESKVKANPKEVNVTLATMVINAMANNDISLLASTPCGEYVAVITKDESEFVCTIYDEEGPIDGREYAEFRSHDINRVLWVLMRISDAGSTLVIDLDKLFAQSSQ